MKMKAISGALLLFIAACYVIAGIKIIQPGEVGILVKMLGENRGMLTDQTLDTGTFWYEPFRYDVISYDVKAHQYEIEDLPAQSKDGQPISVDISVELSLTDAEVPTLHEQIGQEWFERVIYPAIRSTVRNETAEFESEQIYTGAGRKAIKDAVFKYLVNKDTPAVHVNEVNLRDLTFVNDTFVKTLEEKATAAQQVIIAERKAAQAVHDAEKMANIAEGEKQKRIKAAEADREERRLEGEGERLKQEEIAKGILAVKQAEAEGNRLQVAAFGGGQTYASVRWAEEMGPNVQVLGYPLGAEGTTGIFNVDGILGKALKLPGGE